VGQNPPENTPIFRKKVAHASEVLYFRRWRKLGKVKAFFRNKFNAR
jgi:hypothetical protein